MIYNEKMQDLFSVDSSYYLAHCISSDFGMGKGIAVLFNKYFDMKNLLVKKYISCVDWWDCYNQGTCILEGKVFNLITKRNYWNKPTYETMEQALIIMKKIALENGILKIAMPVIGSGLDKLNWEMVSNIIKKVFEDTDIEILVCKI